LRSNLILRRHIGHARQGLNPTLYGRCALGGRGGATTAIAGIGGIGITIPGIGGGGTTRKS
jgi:hypothetical protein